MSVSADAPALDIAYKLAAYAGVGRTKLSLGKRILPGAKQVFRRAEDGTAADDVIARDREALPGEPLLRPMMRGGRRLRPRPPLARSRAEAAERVGALPARLRGLAPAEPPYPVAVSPALALYERQVRDRVRGGGGRSPSSSAG